MALQICNPCFFATKPYRHLPSTFLLSPSQKPKFIINSQNQQIDTEPAKEPSKPSTALGFGPSSSSSSTSNANGNKTNVSTGSGSNTKKQKSKRERATINRRSPIEKPLSFSKEEELQAKEQSKTESAFLLTWLVLGGVIFVQGIALASSGFLPEEWDKFLVKYLYPSFTPTVSLFFAGTVTYGVLKYLQNEELKKQK